MAVTALTADIFDGVINNHGVVVVDFWAPWCGPCRAFAPIYERVAEQFPEVFFAKVNTDEEAELSSGFQIRSIPTLVIFREGIIVFMQPGMLPESTLIDLLGQAQNLDMAEVRRQIAEKSE